MAGAEGSRFALLDPLRGVAALWVFAFHLSLSPAWERELPALFAVLRQGDLGVPMFFVISGFCIAAAGRSAARDGAVVTFLRRRLRRIYPPYWASVLVVAAVPFVIEAISAVKTGRFDAPSPANLNFGYLRYDLVDWVEVLSLLRVFQVDPNAGSLQYKFTTINAVYWTLAIEVQFYLVVALAVAMRRRFYAVLAGVTLASIPFALTPSTLRWGIFLPYWPMFAVGATVFWLTDRQWSVRHLLGSRAPAVAAVALLLLLASVAIPMGMGFPMERNLFAVVVGLVLYLSYGVDPAFRRAIESWKGPSGLLVRLGVALGAMSYTIYLLHGRVQFLALQSVRQFFREPSVLQDCGVVVVTLALCYPFYRYCERPFVGAPKRLARPVGG